MSFLGVEGKRFLVLGVANRKSVAWAVSKILEAEGAEVLAKVRQWAETVEAKQPQAS